MTYFGMLLGVAGLTSVVLSRRFGTRVAIALFAISGSIFYISDAPSGFLPAIIGVAFVRNLKSLTLHWRSTTLPGILFVSAYLLAVDSSPFTVRVICGMMLYLLISAYLSSHDDSLVLAAIALGSLVFAIFMLSRGTEAVPQRVNGELVFISRILPPELDPNSSAGLALLGMAALLVLARRASAVRGALLFLLACILCFFVIRTAARFASIASLGMLIAFLFCARWGLFARLLMAATFIGLAVAGYSGLAESGSLARFAQLDTDWLARLTIYSDWLSEMRRDVRSTLIGLPADDIARMDVAPHNTVFEIWVHYGAIGLVLVVWVIWQGRPRQPSVDGFRQFAVLPNLGLGLLIGMLSLYQPWIAIALAWPRAGLIHQGSGTQPDPRRRSRPKKA